MKAGELPVSQKGCLARKQLHAFDPPLSMFSAHEMLVAITSDFVVCSVETSA
jgi:hypothetical protein